MRSESDDEDGKIMIERCPSQMSNGLTLSADGKCLACEHAGRRVSLPGMLQDTLVDHYNGKRLNSPNDIVVGSDGTVLFTDPTFGLTAEFGVLGE
ncbi:hypothetical protein GCM10025859_15550 [Alicyclobacillus fastidiosus]|nr:hypothetical protein GCM10025859_15550 [Alicyclobacillus fastidiosus]